VNHRLTPNQNGNIVWTDRVVDADGDSLSISLKLKGIDDGSGLTPDGRDSTNISWLSFTKQENSLQNGALETLVEISADRGELDSGSVYKFELQADDGGFVTTKEIDLQVRPPEFVSLMGQEDRFRQDNGNRIDQGGTGRIVAHTKFESDLDLEYVSAPVDVDNPTFDQSISDISLGKKTHQFFFNVSPDTLYAFRVTAKFGAGVTKTSDVFYLETGSEVDLSPAELSLPTTYILSQNTDSTYTQEAGGTGVFEAFHSSIVSDESLAENLSTSNSNSSFPIGGSSPVEVGGSSDLQTFSSNQVV